MNNDISSEFTNYMNPRIKHASKKSEDKLDTAKVQSSSRESYEAAQSYYGALGRIKVNLDSSDINARVTNSLDIFKKDPDYVQSHIDFCDALQEQGYSLEDAVVGTDIIFEKLKDETTYKS